MKYEKNVVLKDGRECIIRNASKNDAQAICKSFKLTHGETDFLLTYPEESNLTQEQEEKFLEKMEISRCDAELCAVVCGNIVGTAGIEAIGQKEKIKHRADLGISVEKEYWGLGIGKELLKACIECGKRAGYVQMELSVVASNNTAVELYKKLGFIEYGRNPLGFRSRIEGWQELILMRLLL